MQAGSRRASRLDEQHERQQTKHLGLVGHQGGEQSAEADRLLTEHRAHQRFARQWIGDRDGSDGDGRASAQTAPIVVERYLSALEHKDRSALRELAPPGYDASTDVEDRLATYGGIRQERTPR